MTLDAIDALSPLDGRYAQAASPLRALLSEAALIRARIRVEACWLLQLDRHAKKLDGLVALKNGGLAAPVRAAATALCEKLPDSAIKQVKTIEARTNHDVKAVEYFVREQLSAAGADAATLELVHFGCTSEDVNNLSYALLLGDARQLLASCLAEVSARLSEFAQLNAALAMLARTHGQTASPTTLGKEFANVVARLNRAQQRFAAIRPLGKWNGAVGNFNAHVAVLPAVDWPALAQQFVESFGLEYNAHTTQIEPHDWIAAYCDALAAINVILIDLARDIWGYISLGYLQQRTVAGEIGSSTMPHKVNPIDFENAEGNLGVANALLRHFSDKLPVSRWQRDLTDSTVLRNLGVALGHSFVAWRALLRGLSKIDANPSRINADLQPALEVLGEAVQTALRAAGVPNGYERLKDFTRGRSLDLPSWRTFVTSLPLDSTQREQLLRLTPADYVGLAASLTRDI